MARAQLDLVADVGVAVDVYELDGARQAVVAGGTEVHGPGVDETHPHERREPSHVRVALLDRRAGTDGRVEDGVRACREDRPPRRQVALGGLGAVCGSPVDVVVDDGGAGGETAERIVRDLVRGAGNVGIPVLARHAVDGDLDDDRRPHAAGH